MACRLSKGLPPPLEDEHAAVPADGKEHAIVGIQLCAVRRGAYVRASSQGSNPRRNRRRGQSPDPESGRKLDGRDDWNRRLNCIDELNVKLEMRLPAYSKHV